MSVAAPATPNAQQQESLEATKCQQMCGAHETDQCATKLCDVPAELRVYRVDILPGQKTSLHTNNTPYTAITLCGGSLEALDANGQSLGKWESKCGDANTYTIQGDFMVKVGDATCRYSKTHCVQNVGMTPYSEYVVEILNPAWAGCKA